MKSETAEKRMLGEFTCKFYTPSDTAWERSEQDLAASGVMLPLQHRAIWAKLSNEPENRYLAVHDQFGLCKAGFAVKVSNSRALPGHKLLRVTRCGPGADPGAMQASFTALTENCRRNRRILRVNVELFSPDPSFVIHAREILTGLGFRRSMAQRAYEHTLRIDLAPDEAGILASFHSSARRKIKSISKHPLEMRQISDFSYVPRMTELLSETFRRAGAIATTVDWKARIELSRLFPSLSHLIGLFRTDVSGPESLLAFTWACNHCDHAEYEAGASTRDLTARVSLMYPLMWESIRWAKRCGVSWFDLGGVTEGKFGDPDDPLGGISDFKRFFSREVIRVGEEWEYVPRPFRMRIARTISNTASWVSRLLKG